MSQIAGPSVIRGRCGQKHAGGFVAERGAGMRQIAMFVGPHASEAQNPSSSLFSPYFNRFDRFAQLATSSLAASMPWISLAVVLMVWCRVPMPHLTKTTPP